MGTSTLLPCGSRVSTFECQNQQEYASYLKWAVSMERYLLELRLAELHASGGLFTLPGFCLLCERAVEFQVRKHDAVQVGTGQQMPCWREQMVCPTCGLNNRMRLVAHLALESLDGAHTHPRVYAMEQVTPLYRVLSSKLGATVVTGSEYLGNDFTPGMVVNGVRHENAQSLSFSDQSFDLVLSCEVFEHIPDSDIALREVARVLRPGAQILMTVPFFSDNAVSVRRAGIENGVLVHYLPRQFHGNPLSAEGSLVFTEHGWDLLDRMRNAGFERVSVRYYWSYEYGHLDVVNSVFHGTKQGL